MQLKDKKNANNKKASISQLLAGASCALLTPELATAAEDHGWKVDTAVLYYSEKDRVDAVEPVMNAAKTFEDSSVLTLKVAADTLTGASPNGATPSDQPQTFTRPSGNGEYTTPAGDTPLDDTFKDSRGSLSVQYEFPIKRLTRLTAGATYSKEYDYSSAAVNVSIAQDINGRNTTLFAGVAFAADTIDPEGGIPTPLAPMLSAGDEPNRQGVDEDKDTLDILLGVTQIINSRALMQLNYAYSNADGYLTDPFKIVSQVDAVSGRPDQYLYEHRPDSRTKQSVYWKAKYQRESGHIVSLSYRYLWDDWEIDSHTIDFRYRWPFAKRHYIEPHIRFYTQTEAEFYQHSVVTGSLLPTDVSNDSRLGSFDGLTYGAKYGYKFSADTEVSLRLEYYQQSGDSVGELIGIQHQYDQFPDLEAIIVQLGYSFRY